MLWVCLCGRRRLRLLGGGGDISTKYIYLLYVYVYIRKSVFGYVVLAWRHVARGKCWNCRAMIARDNYNGRFEEVEAVKNEIA